MIRANRTLTTFAVGFLLLDAVLLGYAGYELGRPSALGLAGICALGAGAVVLAWRRHRRRLWELELERREIRAEVESIRELLQSQHLDN